MSFYNTNYANYKKRRKFHMMAPKELMSCEKATHRSFSEHALVEYASAVLIFEFDMRAAADETEQLSGTVNARGANQAG
jgi:hypothetical protein